MAEYVTYIEQQQDYILTHIVPQDVITTLMRRQILTQEEATELLISGETLLIAVQLTSILPNKSLPFDEFLDVLEDSGCNVLHAFLTRSSSCDQLQLFHVIFDIHKETLQDILIVEDLLDSCIQLSCINPVDAELIRSELESGSPLSANDVFLERLRKRSVTWFPDFLWILDQHGLRDVGNMLKPGLLPCGSLNEIRRKCGLANVSEKPLKPRHQPKAVPVDDFYEDMDLSEHATKIDDKDDVQSSVSSTVNRLPSIASEHDPFLMLQAFQESDDTQHYNRTEKTLQLSPVQMTLAAPALDGRNLMIVSPTNSGKTFIALYIIQDALERPTEKRRHALFLVPKRMLVEQQHLRVVDYLGHKFKSRAVTGDEQNGNRIALDEIYPRYDILVLTPAILVDRLKDNSIPSLSPFSLIIFDECHSTTKNHPYNQIMQKYLEEKMKGQAELPQIIALTASPGTGHAQTVETAKNHILRLCANLDIQDIRQMSPSDLRNQPVPAEEPKLTPGREVDPFFDHINRIMGQIEERMIVTLNADLQLKSDAGLEGFAGKKVPEPPPERLSERYMQWLEADMFEIKPWFQDDAARLAEAGLKRLRMFHVALLLNSDAQTADALAYIRKKMSKCTIPGNPEFDQLFIDVEELLKQVSKDPSYRNRKLDVLKEEILQGFRKSPESRALVFCKTRQLAARLDDWMRKDEELRHLNPNHVVGQTNSDDAEAQTQFIQQQIIKFFSEGKHQVVVSTPVTEEGMDIGALNLVISYQHVTNEISRIQSKGRGRMKDAKYAVHGEQKIVDKDKTNQIREKLMYHALSEITQMSDEEFQKSVKEQQKKGVVEYQGKTKQASLNGDDVIEIHCRDCKALLCTLTDVRTIKGTLRVVINNEFRARVRKRHCQAKTKDEFTYSAHLHCIKCPTPNRIGMEALYQRFPYYSISIDAIEFDDCKSTVNSRLQWKKWKNVPYDIEELSISDKERIVAEFMSGDSESDDDLY